MSVLLPVPSYFDINPRCAPQEDPLSPWAMPSDHIWTKGLRTTEPPDHHVSLPDLAGGICVCAWGGGCPGDYYGIALCGVLSCLKQKSSSCISETFCIQRCLSGEAQLVISLPWLPEAEGNTPVIWHSV